MKTAEDWTAEIMTTKIKRVSWPEWVRKIQADALRHALAELRRPGLTTVKIDKLNAKVCYLDPS